MQTIKEARTHIEKAWGKGKLKDVEYRLLRYTISLEHEDGLLLHNVMTGELIKLDKNEKNFIQSLPRKVPVGYNTLIEKHFLVPVDYDEQKVTEQLRHILRVMSRSNDITSYTILPTTYCNARCFYCYECYYKHVHMTEQCAHDVVRYIVDHSHGKNVSICWFGGEPLVGVRRISQISRELTDCGVEFTSSMISNGALFNEEMVREAVDQWKLKQVQITLDGTEDVYNKVKDYVGMKESPYQTVLKNIRLLSEAGINVSIRINLGFHNEDDIRILIHELCERFADCENVKMYVHELFENEGTDPHTYTEVEKEHLINLVTGFNDYAAEHGKYSKRKHALPSLKFSYCMADNDSAVVVQPGGELTKCEHSSANENFGNIYSDRYDQMHLNKWKKYAVAEKCVECSFYPSCTRLVECVGMVECLSVVKEKKIEEVNVLLLNAMVH